MNIFNYWNQPQIVRTIISKIVPKKNQWTITVKKQSTGDWCFTVPFIVKESLTNGTEKVIDYYFKEFCYREPHVGDTITMVISTTKQKDYDTRISFVGKDNYSTGNYYVDDMTQQSVWLCEVGQVMFKGVPDTFWVKFKHPERDMVREGFQSIIGKDYSDRVFN